MRFYEYPIAVVAAITLAVANASRTQLSVTYEYQLEVEDANRAGSTQDVLSIVDDDILIELQRQFPSQSWDSGLPIITFEAIESEIFSACFTENDECALVRSTIHISYEGEKPRKSVQYVILEKVQEYLRLQTNQVLLSYAYPNVVSALAQFEITSVLGQMNDKEIQVFEETFLEVFGAIVFAIEGDTQVDNASFLYQDLVGDEVNPITLSTNLQIHGFCRECTASDFQGLIVTVAKENIPAFRTKLQSNTRAIESNYFDRAEDVQFQVPKLPSPLPPIADPTLYDNEAPAVENNQPWFLWFGLSIATCIIGFGSYVIFKDQADYVEDVKEEDNFSTSESDSDDSDIESSTEIGGNGPLIEENHNQSYQIEAITADSVGADGNYEVHVF